VQWERSLDGTNWFPEDSENSTYEDGRFSKGPYDPAMSGLRYRAYAWAYEQYTNLPNYQQGQSTSAVENVAPGTWYDRNDVRPYGRVIISNSNLSNDYSFTVVRQGSFRIDMTFDGMYNTSGNDFSFYMVTCYAGSRFVAEMKNKPGESGTFADFDAYPGEIISFNFQDFTGNSAPNPTYGFQIVSKTTNVPYVGSKVVSAPFTLTVRNSTSSSSSSSRLFSSSSSSSSPPAVPNPGP
jgi:hypothetical protein